MKQRQQQKWIQLRGCKRKVTSLPGLQMAVLRCPHMAIPLCVCVLISSYKDTIWIGLGPPWWPHFTFWLQTQSHCVVLGLMIQNVIQGDNLTPS